MGRQLVAGVAWIIKDKNKHFELKICKSGRLNSDYLNRFLRLKLLAVSVNGLSVCVASLAQWPISTSALGKLS